MAKLGPAFNADPEISIPIAASKGQKTETVRRWQILRKETGLQFYFDGRIVVGPKMRLCFILLIHMTTTLTLFLLYDGSHYLEGRIHLLGHWGVPASLIFLYFLNLMAIFKTILTEPGYVTKPNATEQHQNFLTYIALAKYKSIHLQDTIGLGNYCHICQMFREPQVSHCRACNVCFKRSDHHCEILGVCIAKRNLPSFFVFTITVCAFYGIILILGLNSLTTVIVAEMENIQLSQVVFPSLYCVLIGIFFPPCGILVLIVTPFIHTYQIVTNRTSKDRNRRILTQENPKTIRAWILLSISNCHQILFSPTIQSELLAREEVKVPKGYLKTLKRAEKPPLTMEIYEAAKETFHNNQELDDLKPIEEPPHTLN